MDHRLRVQGVRKAPGSNRRPENELLSTQLSQEELNSQGSQPAQNPRHLERRNPIDAEHIQRLGVVTEHEWTAIARAPPQALASERNLPVGERITNVGVQHLELAYRRLACIRRQLWEMIDLLNGLTRRQRQGGGTRRGLPFPAKITNPSSPGRIGGKPVYRYSSRGRTDGQSR